MLNTDGSLITHQSSTAAGGILRDDQGRFVKAFSANLGTCSITRAKIPGIIERLKLAWGLGIRKLRVQMDSRAALSLLCNEGTLDHQHSNLVLVFHELRNRPWELQLSLVYREANYAADYLANLGHSLDLGCHLFSEPDACVIDWLRYALVGVSQIRLINNT
ncbi:Putative ribonuclease H protein At1g65750 [Linum perenne]